MVNTDSAKKVGGLAGVIAGDSSICLCGAADHSLLYRGYPIDELAAKASFEEVAWLLLRGNLPNQQELVSYRNKLKQMRGLPADLKKALEIMPKSANWMDILRTGVSMLGVFEPEKQESEPFHTADRLIACMGPILLYWLQFHERGIRLDLLQQDQDTHAGYLLKLITLKTPSENHRRCLDTSLILYAEHEFNASTFTVRTIASTLSDFYSAICGGIGALRGPLHGGANEAALALIQGFQTPDQAENGIHEMLKNKQLIMGFGHRVYTTQDPRSPIIKMRARQLADSEDKQRLFTIGEKIEKIMWDEKKLFPNLDFYSALAYNFSGIPTPLFTPIFAMSRISGWAAHLLEQRTHNKLIRPNSHYIGPARKTLVSIENRG